MLVGLGGVGGREDTSKDRTDGCKIMVVSDVGWVGSRYEGRD